jgi:hypothetical protein
MKLPKWAEDACEEIDAGFFSSDVFHNKESINELICYLGRWNREAGRIKLMLMEEEKCKKKQSSKEECGF